MLKPAMDRIGFFDVLFFVEPSCGDGCTTPPHVTAKLGVIEETTVALDFGVTVSSTGLIKMT